MTQHLFAGTGGGTTAQLDANFTDLYALLTGTGAAAVASLKVSGVEDGTVIGSRSKSIIFDNNTTVAGAGSEIVWQVGDSLSAQKWAAISSRITGNSGSAASGALVFSTGNSAGLVEQMRIDEFGNIIAKPPASPPSLAVNGQMVMNLTSNTNLRISVRGSDGTTRVANITLA